MTLALDTTASLSNLGEVMAFVDRSCEQLGIGGPAAFAVRLAVEEVCTNIMSYGYRDGSGPLRLEMDVEPQRLVVRIGDRGAPFSPDDAPAPDLTSDLEERRIGGLGIHLVKQMMDEVDYRSDPAAGNTLRLVKRLDSTQ
jgi:anti-sigma regulatory factor (Ser/Thr protein kinase)